MNGQPMSVPDAPPRPRFSERPLVRAVLGLLLLLGCVGAAPAQGVSHVVETEHYRLHFMGTEDDAQEAARVLEAAWPRFREHFGREPKRAAGEKLIVRYYATREDWVKGIRRDGTWPPRSAGGYYWPQTKTAHLFRQPTEYFTRTLLLHEATHQFHYLAAMGNKGPAADWYKEGTAEYLSWHRWDGETLALGVVPGVSLKGFPAAALAELRAKDFDLKLTVGQKVPASRALSWALYSYLATGDDGKPRKGFKEFRRKMDAGGRPGSLVRKYFGDAKRMKTNLIEWLEQHQSPWTQSFNEWEQVGEARMRGHAGVVTACRLNADVQTIWATVEVPARGRWRAGLLLHWTDADDYTVALLDRWGGIQVNRRSNGRWDRLHRARRRRDQGDAEHTFQAVREGEQVSFWIDGIEIGAWKLPGRTMGLGLEACDLHFKDVHWR